MTTVYDFSATTITGEDRKLADYRDKLLLIVNVASKCGFTPQYAGLEKLWRDHKDQGLVVLGFPCDQFGHQEPGTEAEIASFCETSYGVTFPMFAKIEVNGTNAHALYTQLKGGAPGLLGTEAIKWNFTKFLVGRDGEILGRYAPQTTPESLEEPLKPLLA